LGTDGVTKHIPLSGDVKGSAMASRHARPGWVLPVYVACLSLAALITALSLVTAGYAPGNTWALVALVIAAVLTDRASVRLSETTDLTISPVVTLFAAVLFGPLAGGLVGAASELGDPELLGGSRRGRSLHLKWLTYTSTRFMVGAAMGLAAEAVRTNVDSTLGLFAATIAASAVGETLEIFFATLTSQLRGNRNPIARMLGPVLATAVCVYAPVVGALAFAYEEISPWCVFLFLAPAVAAQQLFSLYQSKARLYDEQVALYADLKLANTRLSEANLSFATALVQTLEESDRYTAGHSRAVATYSRDIASKMGLTLEDQERTYLSGLVHDIGKIGLSPSVLNKEGRLTLEEFREMERHSEIGERILSKVDAYSDVALIVRHHHERLDGHGYPDGISGEDIPLISRILAVADAYNAMTSDRPYRAAMVYPAARDRLLQAMGSQFYTDAVVAFLSVLADATDDYRYARGSGFGAVVAPSPDRESPGVVSIGAA
jgi:HD-GYP domain-containing protein (c-di-GMP phosphodiesterase class II)